MLKDRGSIPLETPRLILRKFSVEDAEAMFMNWCQDEAVTRYLTWLPHENIEETQATIKFFIEQYSLPHTYHYLIVLKDTDTPIGSLGCVRFSERSESAEVGYCIARPYWKQGIATEALSALLKHLFEAVGVQRVYARYCTENPSSGKVMEKVGMVYEGIQRKAHKLHTGGFADLGVYSLLKEEYYKIYKGENNGSNY